MASSGISADLVALAGLIDPTESPEGPVRFVRESAAVRRCRLSEVPPLSRR